jgi:hypothetical protein
MGGASRLTEHRMWQWTGDARLHLSMLAVIGHQLAEHLEPPREVPPSLAMLLARLAQEQDRTSSTSAVST